jgi:hypothetical protein
MLQNNGQGKAHSTAGLGEVKTRRLSTKSLAQEGEISPFIGENKVHCQCSLDVAKRNAMESLQLPALHPRENQFLI